MSTIIGTFGSDTLDGTSGSDKINGGAGDDTLIYNLSANLSGSTDIYTGGSGIDTVLLELSIAEWTSTVVQSEIKRYTDWLLGVKTNINGEVSNGSASEFTFDFGTSTLTVRMMEALRVKVKIGDTYIEQDLIDDVVTAREDTADGNTSGTIINVLQNDTVPDLVKSLAFDPAYVLQSPMYGTVQLVKPDLSNASTWHFIYTLNATDPDYKTLAKDIQATDIFHYAVTDANGSIGTARVAVTVTGVNDPAMISDANNNGKNDFEGSVTEAGSSNGSGTPDVSGQLAVSDPDAGESRFDVVSNATRTANGYGTYVVTADGSWTYTLDNINTVVDALAVGAQLTDSFTVYSVDGTSAEISITINGANDAVATPPLPNEDVLWVTSGTAVTLSTSILLKNYIDTYDITDAKNLSITEVKAQLQQTPPTGLKLNEDGTFSFGSGVSEGTVASPTPLHFAYVVSNTDNNTTTTGSVVVNVIGFNGLSPNTIDLSGKTYAGAYLESGVAIDTFTAGTGDTVAVLHKWDGIFIGGAGIDTAILEFPMSSVNPYSNVENFTLMEGIPYSPSFPKTIDLLGNNLNNILTGANNSNVLKGMEGNDTLYGMAGQDFLFGGDGDDIIFGGDGNDYIYGDAGENRLTGGSGADHFMLTPRSVNAILDFSSAEGDKLMLDFSPGGFATDGVFDFSTSTTASAAREGKFVYNSQSGVLFFGAFRIALIGESTHPTLALEDFQFVT